VKIGKENCALSVSLFLAAGSAGKFAERVRKGSQPGEEAGRSKRRRKGRGNRKRWSGEGEARAGRGGEGFVRRREGERERERTDARFFQRGHGRMDVGIMEASTVPSVRDKNCR